MTDKTQAALKLALEALEVLLKEPIAHKAADKAEYLLLQAAPTIREALADHIPDATKMMEPAKQCWKCGDMDAAYQAKCTVTACGMKEQPAIKFTDKMSIDVPDQPLFQKQPAQQQAAWLLSAEWTACVKLPVTVHVRQQRPGETHVSTREGITPVKPDDLIMRGVSGEEYPIGREIFERTYRISEVAPAQQQEPVAKWWSPSKEQFTAWCERHNMQPSDRDAFNDAATLYQLSFAAPASKPWVGLTDDDLENAMEGCIDKWDIAEAIEAKLREKNA